MRRRVRNLLLDVVLGGLRLTLRVLSAVVPTNRSVVLAVFPETEGNGVEVARALLDRYDGRVVWLRDGGPLTPDVAALADRGMELCAKASLRGVWSYLRAEAVLFTHGLYGSPRPARRKPVVNLWHGDGPKDVEPGKGVGAHIASTWLVGSTPLWSQRQADVFDVPRERVILTGNARTDQLWRDPEPGRLAELGITGDFVVWMPTFRQPRAIGAVRVGGNAGAGAGDDELLRATLVEALAARGWQLVVKPHPMDADRRRWPGAVTVDEDSLSAAEVSLYTLLGASRGLVTDYSSVWVDYLLLDRPIAFVVADRDSYDRVLYPADVLEWVPGELVGPDAPFTEFLADLDSGGQLGREERDEIARRVGLVQTRSSADDLVSRLLEEGVLEGARSERGRRKGRSRKT